VTFLVTGAAGFVGFHCAKALLDRGETVIGIDNLSSYYSLALKQDRIAVLGSFPGFTFRELDIADADALQSGLRGQRIRRVIHLAAQPGVRYSLTNPQAFIQSNLVGFANMLEFGRSAAELEHMVYASSSSVYGGNTKLPFSEADPVDQPVSLYAATKRADELMSYTYSHLYGLPLTGLRFFTVYGPWGRPDMAVWGFTEAILAGKPIQIFNGGNQRRDFTYIDDIVNGVLSVAEAPAQSGRHRLFNIGNNRPENLMHMIAVLEESLGKVAIKEFLPAQPGDLVETYADIDAIRSEFGFQPRTPIEVGIPNFTRWYRDYTARRGSG